MKLAVAVLTLAVAVFAEEFDDFGDYDPPAIPVDAVNFTLYRRKSGSYGVQLYLNDSDGIKRSGFDSKLPVVVVTHGYMSGASGSSVQGLRMAFHDHSDCNFIAIDWSKYSKNALYEKVALSVKAIGLHVSKFLRFLRNESAYDLKKLHLIGHSLGAQIISFASNEFPGEKVGRITGLDPAAPMFEKLPPQERLDPSDALFVDVLHVSTLYLGVWAPVGTVDFYPNGGNGQPGCGKYDFSCHHNMAHRYYAHSVIIGNGYDSVKCDSVKDAESGNCSGEKAFMGIGSITATPGIYYAKITKAPDDGER